MGFSLLVVQTSRARGDHGRSIFRARGLIESLQKDFMIEYDLKYYI